ncbi:MAG: DUF3179 domain-containing (seleno)protein [Halopenitus sp.]
MGSGQRRRHDSDRRVNRRRILAAVGVGVGLAGCLDGAAAPDAADPDSDAPASSTDGSLDATPDPDGTLAEQGWPSDICSLAPTAVGLRPIVDPEPADRWPGVTVGDDFALRVTGEPADDVVIGVERDGDARAYPLATLWWHEVINDDLGGPLLVTYCPVCHSGLVAERRVDGEATVFEPSGRIWEPPDDRSPPESGDGDAVLGGDLDDPTEAAFERRRNLVMVDAATGSYWSQLLATAICGPARGDRLRPLPATMTTWGEWRAAHPETTVVLPPAIDADAEPGDGVDGEEVGN